MTIVPPGSSTWIIVKADISVATSPVCVRRRLPRAVRPLSRASRRPARGTASGLGPLRRGHSGSQSAGDDPTAARSAGALGRARGVPPLTPSSVAIAATHAQRRVLGRRGVRRSARRPPGSPAAGPRRCSTADFASAPDRAFGRRCCRRRPRGRAAAAHGGSGAGKSTLAAGLVLSGSRTTREPTRAQGSTRPAGSTLRSADFAQAGSWPLFPELDGRLPAGHEAPPRRVARAAVAVGNGSRRPRPSRRDHRPALRIGRAHRARP